MNLRRTNTLKNKERSNVCILISGITFKTRWGLSKQEERMLCPWKNLQKSEGRVPVYTDVSAERKNKLYMQ